MSGARSLKNTAVITPRLAVFAKCLTVRSLLGGELEARASVRLVCQPLIVTVSYGSSTHLRALEADD